MDLDQLRAALDEDERVAQAAIGVGFWFVLGVGDEDKAQRLADQVRRQTPERVLRWVRAAREILAELERAKIPANGLSVDGYRGRVAGLELAVLSLMSVYGDTDG
jgi:hypothetical protein